MANSTSGVSSGQSSWRSLTKDRSTSSTTALTRSTLLVVWWWCGEPKMREDPIAACRAVQNSLVKRVSRSETRTSGKPTSRKTEGRKLRAATSDVALLKVGTSQTRPVSRSMWTCMKSSPERAVGSSIKSRLMAPPLRVGTGSGKSRPAGGPCSALTRWQVGHAETKAVTSWARPGHHTRRRARESVLVCPKWPPRGVACSSVSTRRRRAASSGTQRRSPRGPRR
mmetsp:Transcript_17145/g.47118  ORF Transcript_17145/g.47118 Transcript_17145/m.47118 type:complete len:225 (+) Transcript_17145:261-935(+)